MKQNYSIKFISCPTSGEDVTIYIRLILNRKKTEFSTGIRGLESDWDTERQRFAERTNYNRNLNHQITCAEDRIEDTYKTIVARGVRPTTGRVRNEFRGEKDVKYQPEILHFIDNHIEMMKKQPDTYKPGTVIHYVAMHKRLKKYLKHNGEERKLLKDFKAPDIIGFKEFLLTTPHETLKRPMSPATSGKYLAKLKVIMGNALMKEIILTDPFKGVKIDRVENEAEWLTQEELQQLSELDLSGNDCLHRVRLMFLFSVYSGLRYSDAFRLKKDEVTKTKDGNYRINLIVKKTGKRFDRRMLPEATALYHKMLMDYPDQNTVLPTLSNQKINEYLKVIANLMNIKKRITHHTARHTFATTVMLENGADIKLVSHMLGHRSIKVTESIYARYTRRAEDTGLEDFFQKRSKVTKPTHGVSAIPELTTSISLN